MHKAITLHLMRHAAPQLAHALGLHPHEGAACDLGQWRRWGEATPALGVLEALFCILPRRCRPTLTSVGLQGGAHARQEQPVDRWGSRMQCEWVPCVGSPRGCSPAGGIVPGQDRPRSRATCNEKREDPLRGLPLSEEGSL